MPKNPRSPTPLQNAAAFEQLRPELEALPAARLRSYRGLSPRGSALEAWRIARASQRESLRQRFEALASIGEIAPGSTERLALAAQAVLHLVRAHHQGASSAEARVPTKRIEEGYKLRGRTMRVLEYTFGDDTDSKVPERLEHMRKGSGHLDLVEDLADLSALYREHKAQLGKEGGRHYKATDEAEALEQSEVLLRLLTAHQPTDSAEQKHALRGAMTLLQDSYDEVKAAGRLFFRHDNPEGRYPALQAIGRASSKGDEEGMAEEEAPEKG